MIGRRSKLTHLLTSGLAAAALVAFWVGSPLEGSSDASAESVEPVAVASPAPVAAAPAPLATAPTPAALVATASVSVESTPPGSATDTAPVEASAPVPAVELIEVPNLSSMSVWDARKRLKKHGLRFAFKEGSRRVHHDEYDFYRVRKQSVAAGERVPAGSKITLQVRGRKFASGY